MTIEEFRTQLVVLLEKARLDPDLSKNGRTVVVQMLACIMVVAHRSGGTREQVAKLCELMFDAEFDHPLSE